MGCDVRTALQPGPFRGRLCAATGRFRQMGALPHAERTVEATWQRIGALLDLVTPAECRNDFANAGYAS